ncbi:MAG TPA: DUF2007 domain-containing protein [Planctomycetaceae bacterium]
MMITPNRLVTLETFPAPATASFIRDLLVAEGVPAFIADEQAMVMLWYVGNSIGWVKLQVAESDVGRAHEILEAHRQTMADLGHEAFAAEATDCLPADAAHETAFWPSVGDERDVDVEDPLDQLASRALRSAVMGMGCAPLAIYGAWLVGGLVFSSGELSAAAARKLWLAFGITFMVFLTYAMPIGGPALVVGIGGSVVGAFCIRGFTRWINRRDDPRHASRPVS